MQVVRVLEAVWWHTRTVIEDRETAWKLYSDKLIIAVIENIHVNGVVQTAWWLCSGCRRLQAGQLRLRI